MGGPWERMIRSVRKILRALLKEQVVCNEVLSTVLTEATNILNRRPLTQNSDDPMDKEPLTPNHLFQLRPCGSVPCWNLREGRSALQTTVETSAVLSKPILEMLD